MKKEQGLSLIILLISLAIIVGLAAFWYVGYRKGPSLIPATLPLGKDVFVKKSGGDVDQGGIVGEEFETLEQGESTPEEINNDVVEELDALILSIEDEEDLSDLEL